MTTNWRDAACRHEDLALFFPGKAVTTARTDAAKRVCRGCPIKDACLLDALDSGDTYAGVRGAHTAEERRQLQRGHPARTRVDRTADIIRLSGKRWTQAAIAARYGLDTSQVYRVLKAHRDRERAAEDAA